MDLDNAISKHAQWKIQLRSAIYKQEALHAENIAQDNLCELGKWLHGDGKEKFGSLTSYYTCVVTHAAFHTEASRVATVINAKRFAEAEAMLEGGKPYALASSAVMSAILALKAEAALIEA
jgi:hypothetical protein